MEWPKQPWTQASYSFPAPGQVTTVGPLLARAHMDGKLHIAGEHACYKFVGYMEGALRKSGTHPRSTRPDLPPGEQLTAPAVERPVELHDKIEGRGRQDCGKRLGNGRAPPPPREWSSG